MPKRRSKTIKNYELKITNKSKKKADENRVSGEFSEIHRRPAKKLKVKNLTAPKTEAIEAANQPPAGRPDKTEFNDEKAEKDKKLFMWAGVSCLMVIFFVIWILNLKSEFAGLNKNAKGEFNWSQAKVELDKAMAQVKESLAEIKKLKDNPKFKALSGGPALTEEQINLLKSKLLNEKAAGTATSTIKN